MLFYNSRICFEMFNRKKISLNAANKPENEKDLIIIFNNMKRSSDFLLHRGAQSTAIGQFRLQLNIITARYRFKYYQDFNFINFLYIAMRVI